MLDELSNLEIARELIIVIMSMLPVAELRLALPWAMEVFNMPWYKALILSIIGNLIPVPFLLLFFDSVAKLISRVPIGQRFVDWLVARTARRAGVVEKYKNIGLMIFVAIPLPLTGAWTASLVAYVLGLKFWRSFLCIGVGVVGAGLIVLALVLLGWIGAVVAGVAFVVLAVLGIWKL